MSKIWAVVTGAGTGIGSALAHELAKANVHVLAIGRRLEPLKKTASLYPALIHTLQADISSEDGLKKILDFIPPSDVVKYLVQNAAVGVPDKIENVKRSDFELALAVNVTAPLFLTQGFLPRLKGHGRILHLGTGVAFRAQLGTSTYGVSKMAFHRLYDQLKVELPDHGVQIANIMVGIVDTEGLWEHYELAKAADLPHTKYFDSAKAEGKIKSAAECAERIKFVMLDTDDIEFSKDWSINDETLWHKYQGGVGFT